MCRLTSGRAERYNQFVFARTGRVERKEEEENKALICENILEAIGNTPIVRLNKMVRENSA